MSDELYIWLYLSVAAIVIVCGMILDWRQKK